MVYPWQAYCIFDVLYDTTEIQRSPCGVDETIRLCSSGTYILLLCSLAYDTLFESSGPTTRLRQLHALPFLPVPCQVSITMPLPMVGRWRRAVASASGGKPRRSSGRWRTRTPGPSPPPKGRRSVSRPLLRPPFIATRFSRPTAGVTGAFWSCGVNPGLLWIMGRGGGEVRGAYSSYVSHA